LFSVDIRRQPGIERQVGDGGHTFECRPILTGGRLVNCRDDMWESL